MKVFFDTNVLLDLVAERRPFLDDSREAISLGLTDGVEGMAADLTFCTVAYVMRSLLQEDRLRIVLRTLLKYVSVVPVGAKAISDAIENFASDFEDEVQLRSAIAAGADVIVTRDKDGFVNSTIPVLTPTEFLDKMDAECPAMA